MSRQSNAKRLLDWAAALGLCDVWRVWNPRARQYTHTLAAYRSHACIDLMFMPALECQAISTISILPRGVSDHSPLALHLGTTNTIRTTWRLNAWFLQDPEFKEALAVEIRHYFHTNPGTVSSPGTLWEAGKATLRGVARGLVHAKRAAQMAQLTQRRRPCNWRPSSGRKRMLTRSGI